MIEVARYTSIQLRVKVIKPNDHDVWQRCSIPSRKTLILLRPLPTLYTNIQRRAYHPCPLSNASHLAHSHSKLWARLNSSFTVVVEAEFQSLS